MLRRHRLITGHSYIVYGPLSLGTTSVMYEGVPTYPDPGRPWRIAQRLGVNIFHTAPTTIRMLRKLGPEEPKYDYHFKHMTTWWASRLDVWRWYYESSARARRSSSTPGRPRTAASSAAPCPPCCRSLGSCGPGVLGIYPVIYDEEGNVVEAAAAAPATSASATPAGIFQTIQPERFVEIYYEKYCRNKDSTDWRDWPYFAGDGAVQAADGYFRILGRVDDVITRPGTAWDQGA